MKIYGLATKHYHYFSLCSLALLWLISVRHWITELLWLASDESLLKLNRHSLDFIVFCRQHYPREKVELWKREKTTTYCSFVGVIMLPYMKTVLAVLLCCLTLPFSSKILSFMLLGKFLSEMPSCQRCSKAEETPICLPRSGPISPCLLGWGRNEAIQNFLPPSVSILYNHIEMPEHVCLKGTTLDKHLFSSDNNY